MASDVISIDTAGEIDAKWYNSGMGDGLRLVHYKHFSQLTIPHLNGSAPCYQFRTHDPEQGRYAPAYYHISGPTLADWQAMQQARNDYQERNELAAWASGR